MDDSVSKPNDGDVHEKPNIVTDNVIEDNKSGETNKKKKKLSSSDV